MYYLKITGVLGDLSDARVPFFEPTDDKCEPGTKLLAYLVPG